MYAFFHKRHFFLCGKSATIPKWVSQMVTNKKLKKKKKWKSKSDGHPEYFLPWNYLH